MVRFQFRKLKGHNDEIWDPLPPQQQEPPQQQQPLLPHEQPHELQYAPPQHFYSEFTAFRDETRENFGHMFESMHHLFQDLRAVHPTHFGYQPHHFQGGSGEKRRKGGDGADSSGTHHEEDD